MQIIEAQVIDENHLELLNSIDLPQGTRVTVSIDTVNHDDPQHSEWNMVSLNVLAVSYNETEPDYCIEMIKRPNPEYADE